MLRRHRRAVAAGVTAALLLAAAAAQRRDAPVRYTFRITLGLRDTRSTDWGGRVAVTGGQAVRLTGWRFTRDDVVHGTDAWDCRTRLYPFPGATFPLEPPHGKPPPVPDAPWPLGIDLVVRGERAEVAVTLPQGEVKFRAADVHPGEPQTFLQDQVRVEWLPETSVVRRPPQADARDAVEDDYPAFWVHYRSRKQYLAWVAYHRAADRVLLAERDGPDGAWSKPVEVDGPGDHFRVALATTHRGTLWVVWSAQRGHNWDLYGRPYQDGKLGEVVRLTEQPGPDIWHRMTTDGRGRAWLVWQGFGRDGRSQIFARCADGDGWHEPVRVSDGAGNDWDPVVAADYRSDRVWVGWDGYETGNYQVYVRDLAGGPRPRLGPVRRPDESPLFGAHVSLACDRAGRLWAAWDEAAPEWGKDYGFLDFVHDYRPGNRLYTPRHVRVKCLADGSWREPAADLQEALPEEFRDYNELPQLQDDGKGRLWLAFRHRTCRHQRADGWAIQARWDVYATAYLSDRWLPPVPLPHSVGRLDMRTASQRDPDGNVYFAHASDDRSWAGPFLMPRHLSVAVSRLSGVAPAGDVRLVERDHPLPAVVPVHPREAEQVARVRRYRVESGGRTYRIYRGDIHRHTDISVDGMGDGSLTDLHRYGLDAAALDYIFVTDHNMGGDNEYSWWRTQKANDLYTVPGAFISMYGYERSVAYPNGHRNIIWTERGHRTLPVPRRDNPKAMAEDTARVYAYLRQTHGICTSHTSATDQGTDWKEHDDALEPVVEIFQGYHTSYEAPGAPKAVADTTWSVHGPFRPDGFVSHALAKGYRLGFQASSDHISTHTSCACILAEEFSRTGLVEALKKRHTYAATDNIVLDVRMGRLGMMGDVVRTAEPRLDVVVLGTGAIDRVEVLRDGRVVHTEGGRGREEVRFGWKDPRRPRGEKRSYYYVRVLQKDGQMAWGSPIWVE